VQPAESTPPMQTLTLPAEPGVLTRGNTVSPPSKPSVRYSTRVADRSTSPCGYFTGSTSRLVRAGSVRSGQRVGAREDMQVRKEM
jgi:hypothetical protein